MKLDLTKVNVVEYLSELGMMKIKRDGNEVTFSCPFGLHMKGGAISMRADNTVYSCFGCGSKGNALTFLQDLEDLSTSQAIKWLGERWDVSREIDHKDFRNVIQKKLDRSEKKRNAIITPKNFDVPAISILELDEREIDWEGVLEYYFVAGESLGFEYMLERGFTVETLKEWNIGWDEIKEVFSIPYFDYHGNLIGFKGRALPGIIPKYKSLGNTEKEDRYNFKTLDTANVLFGIDHFKYADNSEMILCEGELNCIAMHQDGFTNTVGISGQHVSDRQLAMIKKFTNKVVLVFDEESKAAKVAHDLKNYIGVSVAPAHDTDPADMTKEEKSHLLLNAYSGVLL